MELHTSPHPFSAFTPLSYTREVQIFDTSKCSEVAVQKNHGNGSVSHQKNMFGGVHPISYSENLFPDKQKQAVWISLKCLLQGQRIALKKENRKK